MTEQQQTETSRGGGLIRAAMTVGSFTMLSRLTGFARDILIAALLGAGPVADAFFIAFKLPNFFRRLFAEGAFNAAFVPLFSEQLTLYGKRAARIFAEDTMAVLLAVLFLFVSAFQVFMPWAMMVMAPGFRDDPATFNLAVELTRITFPYLMFISLVSLMSGVLNGIGRFAAAAAAPVLLNISLIAALLGLRHILPNAGYALAWGVSIAGVVQFFWLAWSCHRAGMPLRLPRPKITPQIRRVLIIMLPAALGAGVVQVNLVIDIVLASLLPEGAISYLFYADRLNQLPIGVVGVAVGTALLPLISRLTTSGDDDGARQALNRAIELGMLLAIPAMAALAVMPATLISALFERGEFDATDTALAAQALAAYALGLPSYILVKVLGPAFFARKDTRTPVKIAVVAVVVNVVLNLILMGPLAHAGLALATAISSWLNALTMGVVLHRRGYLQLDGRLKRNLPRVVAAAIAMAVVLWFGTDLLAGFSASGGEWTRALALAVLVGTGMAVYGIAAQVLGAVNLRQIKAQLRGR
mgnify:CR=1 FL=1